MKESYTDALLKKDISFIRETLSGMEKHLERLNSKVSKNSEFRVKATVYGGIMAFLSTTLFVFILNKLF